MQPEPNFGPFLSRESVRDFSDISKKAFEIYHEKTPSDVLAKFNPTQHLFIRQMYVAETSSFSIRLLTSWAMLLQALALARTRLEHTIICSYLIHEEFSVGLEPFVRHISIKEFLNVKAAMSDDGIANYLDIDISKLKTEAVSAQESFTPDFDIDHDKFERKWTKLDLRSMAKRRDELTAEEIAISKGSLERDYVSLYMIASSIVHSDVSAFSHAFLEIFPTGQTAALMPLPSWATTGVAFTSKYDVVQNYEVLKFLGIDCEGEFTELRKHWITAAKKYLS